MSFKAHFQYQFLILQVRSFEEQIKEIIKNPFKDVLLDFHFRLLTLFTLLFEDLLTKDLRTNFVQFLRTCLTGLELF